MASCGGKVSARLARKPHFLQAGAQDGVETSTGQASADGFDKDMQKQVDSRSIYVGNVDYSVDSKAIAEFFSVQSSLL